MKSRPGGVVAVNVPPKIAPPSAPAPASAPIVPPSGVLIVSANENLFSKMTLPHSMRASLGWRLFAILKWIDAMFALVSRTV